ncbi:hypothetical protein TNCV_4527571 [Trichonephila clavipes]|nr:hypothetical protein TNCV_4527571 [Trichonephila clavipes]
MKPIKAMVPNPWSLDQIQPGHPRNIEFYSCLIYYGVFLCSLYDFPQKSLHIHFLVKLNLIQKAYLNPIKLKGFNQSNLKNKEISVSPKSSAVKLSNVDRCAEIERLGNTALKDIPPSENHLAFFPLPLNKRNTKAEIDKSSAQENKVERSCKCFQPLSVGN